MKKIIVLSVLSLGIVFLTGCSQQQANQNKLTPPTKPTVKQDEQPVVDQNKNPNQQNTQVQAIVYTNSAYGFTLDFPQTWNGYTAKNRTLDWGISGTSDSVDFGFSTQDSLFNISIQSKSQWEKIKSELGPTPIFLGENPKYIFGYTRAQDAADDTMREKMLDIDDILKTFRMPKLIIN